MDASPNEAQGKDAGRPMPILKKEPELFPENLLENPHDYREEAQWFAFYTMSRREKDLMRKLRTLKIAHYGPMVEKRSKSPSGRVRTSYAPLFSGYVFVFGTEIDRYETVSTGCISKCIQIKEQEMFLDDLRRIRSLSEHGEDLQAELRPVIGQKARLIRGPLKDKELVGTITKLNNRHRLTIMVDFLQQGASIVVDEADVEIM